MSQTGSSLFLLHSLSCFQKRQQRDQRKQSAADQVNREQERKLFAAIKVRLHSSYCLGDLPSPFVRPSIHLSVCPFVCLSICLSILPSFHSSVPPSNCLSIHPYICHLPILCLFIHLSILPPTHPSNPPTHSSIHPSVHPSVCPSVHPSNAYDMLML